MRLPETISSKRCAAQPDMRAHANSGVNRSSGMPIIEYTKPEYMSMFAHMSLLVPFSRRITSGARRSMLSSRRYSASNSVPTASFSANCLQMMARGSDFVYTACPMPYTRPVLSKASLLTIFAR